MHKSCIFNTAGFACEKIILVAKISRLEYEKKYGSVVGKEVERSGGELIKVGANFFYVRRRTRKG